MMQSTDPTAAARTAAQAPVSPERAAGLSCTCAGILVCVFGYNRRTMLSLARMLPALIAALVTALAMSYTGLDALGSCADDDCPRGAAAVAESTHVSGAYHAPGGHAAGAGAGCLLAVVLAASPGLLAFQPSAGAMAPTDQSPPGELYLSPGTPPPRPA